MCVGCLPQVLEVLEGVPDHSFVQRAKLRARMTECVPACEVPEVRIDELPIETVLVTHEQCSAFGIFLGPAREAFHDALRVIKAESIFAREPTDGESVWNPIVRDWLQPT